MSEKIQKLLAQSGIGSRREIEKMIADNRITVNGSLAHIGQRISDNDHVAVDGKRINLNTTSSPHQLLIYYKPEGEVCTRQDPEGRATVFDHLPPLSAQRWVMIGRLDINTSGLLLFTTDGEFANQYMHPSFQVLREYIVRISGKVSEQQIHQLLSGVELDDGMAKFEFIERLSHQGSNQSFRVGLREGRNREVRRLWEYFGFSVNRLKRIKYGDYTLPKTLKPGQWQKC